MTSTYDSTGITLDRYADIKARLQALAIAKWGESIVLDEDEYFGHEIENVALLLGEINELWQSVYDGFTVANSTDVLLANLLAILGIEREAAAYSTATLTLTASKATTVPAGTLYGTESGLQFATDTALVFTAAGSDTVESTCTVIGPNDAAAGEIDQIVTSVFGITGVTNAAAIPGRYQETSSEMKTRHATATATTGEDDAASLYQAVSEVTGVSSVYVEDNDTSSTSASGVPANTIYVVVVGGADADVAEAIKLNKTATVSTYGTTTVSVYNTTTRQSKDINFSRGTSQVIYVSASITTDSTYPDDGETQIKTAVETHIDALNLGDDVIYNKIFGEIYGVQGVVSVDTLYIGTTSGPTGTSNITIAATEYAYTDAGNIVIT